MRLESVDKGITIQSSNVHLGDRLPDYARENILRVASKYFGRLNTAAVHFTKDGITYRCSVNMQMGALPMKSAEARDKDIYLAFNAALEKVAKQLRRTKRELREDKAERLDKDVVLRGGASPIAVASTSSLGDEVAEEERF
ncbi:ribosome hibernation-promoting factor, HPF/YfiA family [Microvirga massiliensis]|uniref:ribosome hibernation-promoting factor, HPF/YfiA family n=1 Tax=Microvirga massiliensis TaxID=1033741 RepID=UPI00062B72CF|nr:ribosome-associated translation inhibitor RaiA [Microvirga massiliensis]